MDKETKFLQRLLATFKVEADEHLRGISAGLLALEGTEAREARPELIETIFREAHSLKGAARAVNLSEIEALCQALESVFSALKKEKLTTSASLFDLLQESLDLLGQGLAALGDKGQPAEKAAHRPLIARLEAAARGKLASEPPPPAESGATAGGEIGPPAAGEKDPPGTPTPDKTPPRASRGAPARDLPEPRPQLPGGAETVRVSTARLSAVLLQTEEMLSAKLAAHQRAVELRAATAAFLSFRQEWAKVMPLLRELRSSPPGATTGKGGPGPGRGPRPWDQVLDFLDWNATFVKGLEERLVVEAKRAARDGRALGGMVNTLLDDMKQVLMFPFTSLLEVLPKTVRDLARESGKEVELAIQGGEIEIDRRILEEMKDPLLHLIRNCIDHGIERPEERKEKEKPPRGLITVEVSPRDNKVEILVADDGAGISPSRIKSAVLKLGTLPRERVEDLSDQELIPFAFQSGVSTSPIITEISGRGLGLAIVREKVEKLGGTVTLESTLDHGTRFTIVLPLTVATFRGILVRVGEREFVIPSLHVERAIRLPAGTIRTVENRETIEFQGQPLSLSHLDAVLSLPRSTASRTDTDLAQAVVLCCAGTRIAFLVDEVLHEQEVLQKGLGPQLSRVRNVVGATVLGNGRVVPILNVPDLLKSAVQQAGSGRGELTGSASQVASPRKRRIMVAEDSITTRMLLKNILETAGYQVTTAVDGLDAITRLKEGEFDLVVSDVDMPRMNGFGLTAKIRADKALCEMPVVLVTALESREDRERGIEVGANAYIVKSSFDQSNLLAVLERM